MIETNFKAYRTVGINGAYVIKKDTKKYLLCTDDFGEGEYVFLFDISKSTGYELMFAEPYTSMGNDNSMEKILMAAVTCDNIRFNYSMDNMGFTARKLEDSVNDVCRKTLFLINKSEGIA